MLKFFVFLLATVTFLPSSPVKAADGKSLYLTLTCVACHGKEGRGKVRRRDRIDKKTGKYKYRKGDPMSGFEDYPKLSCQQPKYLVAQMNDIFNGVRKGGKSKAMHGVRDMVLSTAKPGDFEAIADYLSKVRPCGQE